MDKRTNRHNAITDLAPVLGWRREEKEKLKEVHMQLKHMLQAVTVAGLLVLGLGLWEKAEALGPNPNTMVVAVTPSAGSISYGVLISSPLTSGTTGYDFTQVALGATTISTQAIVVTSTGTVAEYFGLAIANSTPDNWTAINTGTPGYDQFMLEGHFVTHGAGQPASTTFSVNTDTMTATVPASASGRYGQSGLGITTPSTPLDLWLMLTMPTTVKTGAGQAMVLTVNGQGS
jgi:hypothetical protein